MGLNRIVKCARCGTEFPYPRLLQCPTCNSERFSILPPERLMGRGWRFETGGGPTP